MTPLLINEGLGVVKLSVRIRRANELLPGQKLQNLELQTELR